MKQTHFILSFIFLSIWNINSQTNLFNFKEIKLKKEYKNLSGLSKYRYDSISYTKARNQKKHSFFTFNYNSDSLVVEGYMCKPTHINTKKHPVIIYNRGGTGNFGKLSPEDFPDFYYLAQHGFIVVASNYRYIGKKGKYDQIAGNDIDDVINLYKQVIKLDYIDANNIFMMGVSRGGLMTYKSLSQITINAAAVIGGVANFKAGIKKRPIFLNGWNDLSDNENYLGLKNILPDFQKKKEFYFQERNALAWADKIKTPIYILHSRLDGRVSVTQALNMTTKLHELNKKYKLKIYSKKSHSLPYSKFDSFNEIIYWFKTHIKKE